MAAAELPPDEPSKEVRGLVLRLLERLADVGARPTDSHDERLRQGTLIFASLLITVLSVIWVSTYFAYGYPLSAAIPAAYQVLSLVGLVVLARTRRFEVFRTTQLVAFLVFPALLQASLGGFVASSGMILWGIFTPLAALALLGVRRSIGWLAALLAMLVALALLDPWLSAGPAALPRGFVVTFFVLNLTGVTISAYVMLGYFVAQRQRAHQALERAHRELESERERSERLLLNVLPGPIAERLKAGTGVIAEHYDSVSVLFADLVGFTERSAVDGARRAGVPPRPDLLGLRPARGRRGFGEDQDDRRRLHGGRRAPRTPPGPPRSRRPDGTRDAGGARLDREGDRASPGSRSGSGSTPGRPSRA